MMLTVPESNSKAKKGRIYLFKTSFEIKKHIDLQSIAQKVEYIDKKQTG
jgi:hypothetical protein